MSFEIDSLGDAAVSVRLEEQSHQTPRQSLERIVGVMEAIGNAHIPGVIECTSAYTTVTVFYDAATVAGSADDASGRFLDRLKEQIRQAMEPAGRRKRMKGNTRRVDIPILCESEFAPDLEAIATNAGLTIEEALHSFCAAIYSVSCLGFTPGFPYLAGLPALLAMPRRLTPRKEIPAGSVAIGGNQAGIYPVISPGGWNVIGRTPLKLFDPEQAPPTLLRPGDEVRFRRMTRGEWDEKENSKR
jgi:inhibitor of KinA